MGLFVGIQFSGHLEGLGWLSNAIFLVATAQHFRKISAFKNLNFWNYPIKIILFGHRLICLAIVLVASYLKVMFGNFKVKFNAEMLNIFQEGVKGSNGLVKQFSNGGYLIVTNQLVIVEK